MLERDFCQLLERMFDTDHAYYPALQQEYCLTPYACGELLLYAQDIARKTDDDTPDWQIVLCQNIFCLVDCWLAENRESRRVHITRAASELIAYFYLGAGVIPQQKGGSHG